MTATLTQNPLLIPPVQPNYFTAKLAKSAKGADSLDGA